MPIYADMHRVKPEGYEQEAITQKVRRLLKEEVIDPSFPCYQSSLTIYVSLGFTFQHHLFRQH
jgi:hypothetical protein